MPMNEDIRKELSMEEHTPFHQQLLTHCLGLADMARMKMSSYYKEWDLHDETYRATRVMDKDDEVALERKEPAKMTVPVTYSQIQTFISFCFAVFFQRETFFELIAVEEKAERAAKVGELLLQRDLNHNNFVARTYQFLLDCARFGLGIFKCGWREESQWTIQETPATEGIGLFGIKMFSKPATREKVRAVKYQGNEIRNVSPYRFLPDTRLPISDFQRGEFCGSEDEFSFVELQQMQAEGSLAGVDFVRSISSERVKSQRKDSRLSADILGVGQTKGSPQSSANVVITEMVVKLVPSKFMIEDKPMGPEEYPVKYLVWIANDQRLIRVEPFAYLHDEFPYQVSQFSPDIHKFINEGLSGSIDQLQDLITWYINAHVASVRNVIQNRLVVDPDGVNMDDIRNRRSVVRLKSGKSRLGIERWVQQLNVQDVTANHMEDADQVHRLIQVVSGINDNALGQFHTGRRSATEARNVSSGTASRLKMGAAIIYYNAFEPLGKQMISNLRDGLTLDVYVKIFGLLADPTFTDYFEFAKVSNRDLIGEYDFAIFDGTMPSEKFYTADALTEVLQLTISSPEIAVYLGLDIRSLMFEILRLRGVRHPERFTVSQQQQLMALQMMQMTGGQPTQNGQPKDSSGNNGNGNPARNVAPVGIQPVL